VQQFERFRRDSNLALFPFQLSGVEIEDKWAEANSHDSPFL
jgi:hypothetical protein